MKKELIISYTRKDFRVDTFTAGGPGGQHQNKTQSGVRITHIPTGLSSECREFRNQGRNKKIAFSKLGNLILQYHKDLENKKRIKNKSDEVVRTYHAVDNRVKDHSTGDTSSYDEVMNDISEMMELRRSKLITRSSMA